MKSVVYIGIQIAILLFLSIIATGQNFRVVPAILDFKLDRGQSDNQTIELQNNSDKEESFVISTKDEVFNEVGDMVFAASGSSATSCANYIKVTPAFVTLNPNEKVKLKVLMEVPDELQTTKWSVVAIRVEREFTAITADLDAVRAGLIITPEIAVQVTQTPSNLSFKKISILDFYEIPESLTDSLRVFKVRLKNDGEVITKGKVYLTASNLETLQEVANEPVEVGLFPNVLSEIQLTLKNDMAPGIYSLAAIVDYGEEYELQGMEIEIKVK